MSQQNVDAVHRLAAAVGRRDVDEFLELTDPAIAWHSSISVLSEGGAYHGHEGVRQYFRDLDDTFESFEGAFRIQRRSSQPSACRSTAVTPTPDLGSQASAQRDLRQR